MILTQAQVKSIAMLNEHDVALIEISRSDERLYLDVTYKNTHSLSFVWDEPKYDFVTV